MAETVKDFRPNDEIEAVGCLGHCEKGANVQINGKIIQEIQSPLELSIAFEKMDIGVPKVYVAAMNVLEKASKGEYSVK